MKLLLQVTWSFYLQTLFFKCIFCLTKIQSPKFTNTNLSKVYIGKSPAQSLSIATNGPSYLLILSLFQAFMNFKFSERCTEVFYLFLLSGLLETIDFFKFHLLMCSTAHVKNFNWYDTILINLEKYRV